MPCFSALRLARRLPACVRGPVLRCALRRLAATRAAETLVARSARPGPLRRSRFFNSAAVAVGFTGEVFVPRSNAGENSMDMARPLSAEEMDERQPETPPGVRPNFTLTRVRVVKHIFERAAQ